MKGFFYTILFVLVVFSLNFLFAQESKLEGSQKEGRPKVGVLGVPQSLLDICNRFFDKVIAVQIEQAFDELINNSPLRKKKEELDKLISETKRANLLYGQIKAYEPVSSDIVSESYIRIRYLAYHTDFPMRWIFTFYKSPKLGWIVVNIRFDDLSDFFFKED